MSEPEKKWLPCGAATLIGSLPHRDRRKAIGLVFEEMREIPVWPQLSPYPLEQMMAQYNEGLPGLVCENNRTWFVTSGSSFEQELLHFYEEYLAVTEGELPLSKSRFRFGDDTGKTFFSFLERLSRQQPAPNSVKGQITGPFTLLSGLRDAEDRLSLYDPRLRDTVVKSLALKARWQAELLDRFSDPPLIFIDEPGLAGFGSSAFISVSATEVRDMLEEVASHIHEASALAGIHVCANTDWSLFFGSSLDLINFDAYNYFDRFILYRSDLLSFIERGGVVAWGIVPTMEEDDIKRENVDSLASRCLQQLKRVAGEEIPLATVFRQSLITPSCGCGTLSEALAEKVIHLTRGVSERLRQELNS
ncbi:MAG: hypothetical protein JSU72_18365 [Deltaproteobacteria bacterium]|nr:MAG: hypothetical protein JSU72_18365 [Deltaproteobacteria bacterium]